MTEILIAQRRRRPLHDSLRIKQSPCGIPARVAF